MPGAKYNTDKFVSNFVGELQIFDGLKFRSSVGLDLAFWGNHSYTQQYFLSSKNYAYDTVTENETYDKDGNVTVTTKPNYATSASQEMNRSLLWQVENVLSYEKTFRQTLSYRAFGTVGYLFASANVGASAKGLKFPYDTWKISVNNTLGLQQDGNRNGWAAGTRSRIVWPLTSVVYHTTSMSAT